MSAQEEDEPLVSDFTRHCEQIRAAAYREELDALNRREDHFEDELYTETFVEAQQLGSRQGCLEASLDFFLLFPQPGLPPREQLLAARAEVRAGQTAERLDELEAKLVPLLAALEAESSAGEGLSGASAEED